MAIRYLTLGLVLLAGCTSTVKQSLTPPTVAPNATVQPVQNMHQLPPMPDAFASTPVQPQSIVIPPPPVANQWQVTMQPFYPDVTETNGVYFLQHSTNLTDWQTIATNDFYILEVVIDMTPATAMYYRTGFGMP